jgi:glycosyltransferase involved in cell wall biosynthesis
MACKRSGVQFPSAPPMTMVAIVMRTYERPVLLARAIASVQNQSFADWELIIVNNGGDPVGVEAVVSVARTATGTSKIAVLHLPERVGMEEASNQGLRATSSEYFAIHDDDDSWRPTFLETAVGTLSAHPPAAAVLTGVTRVHETFKGGKVWPEFHENFPLDDSRLTYDRLIGGNTFPPIAALFRRSLLEKIGYFDSSLPVLGDWEFNLRAVREGGFVFVPERLANYHTRTPESDRAAGNSITVGEDLHMRVKKELQARWDSEMDPNGKSKGAFSREVEAKVEEAEARLQAEIAAAARAHSQGRTVRRVARAIRHPKRAARAVMRRVRPTAKW